MSEETLHSEEITYCAVHPERETALRCNKCERYMCAQCAVQTPVGYRCRECVRQHEDKFFRGTNADYLISAAVCAGLGMVGGAIMSAIGGFLLFAIILGFPAGAIVSEMALRATQRRRGRYSPEIAAAAVVGGGFAGAALRLYLHYQNTYSEAVALSRQAGAPVPPEFADAGSYVMSNLTGDIGLLIFIGIAAFAVYSRYKM